MKSINRWFTKAKPASSIVPICRFVDRNVFATKEGGYGICFQAIGIDSECLTEQELNDVSNRIETALRLLPQDCSIFQYAIKRRGYPLPHREYSGNAQSAAERRIEFLNANAEFGSLALYWCVYLSPPKRRRLSPEDKERYGAKAVRQLKRASVHLKEQLAGTVSLESLDADGSAYLFSYLLTLEPHLATKKLKSMISVDRQVVGASITWQDDFLKIGRNRYAQVFSMLERPKGTRPNMLSALFDIDIDVVVCSVWASKTTSETRKEVRSQEGFLAMFQHNLAVLAAHATSKKEAPKTASSVAAESGTNTLADVLVDVEQKGRQYGHFSMFGMVHSTDPAEVQAVMPQIHRCFQDPGEARILEETYGAMSGYYSIFPGNGVFDVRRAWLQAGNFADMAFVYGPNTGSLRSESLDDEYLTIYETRNASPFFFDPYIDGLRGLLILGPPRSGKSMNGNHIVDSEQKYDGFTYIFDIGCSYESTVLSHGGTVTRIGIDGPRVNPFSLQPTPENLSFLFRFVKLLLYKSGISINPEEENELSDQIESMYCLPREVRRLKHLVLAQRLQPGLAKWTEGGVFGNIFDNTEDTLQLSRFQCFDFQDVGEEHLDMLEPVLFWLIKRINSTIHNPANLGIPKHLLFDEVWKQLRNPQLLDMVLESLKTGGKHLAGVTLLTHLVDDLGQHARLIKNACPMTMFLRDPSFDRSQYGEFFGLNEQEIENLASLGQREVLLKTPSFSKILVLNLDSESYGKYSTKPRDIQRRNKLIGEHGFTEGIRLMASSG